MDDWDIGPPVAVHAVAAPTWLPERAPNPPQIRLTHDRTRAFGSWANGGTCRIRIFESPGRPPVVVCSGVESSPGTSVCSVAEFLAAAVVGKYFPSRFDEPDPVIWIEHHPCCADRRRRGAARLDVARVTFASWKPVIVKDNRNWRAKLGEPTWTPISPDELHALIGDLELIGE